MVECAAVGFRQFIRAEMGALTSTSEVYHLRGPQVVTVEHARMGYRFSNLFIARD